MTTNKEWLDAIREATEEFRALPLEEQKRRLEKATNELRALRPTHADD